MVEESVNFTGKDSDELFQFYFRQHWIRLMPRFAKLLLGSIIILAVGYVSLVTIHIDNTFSRHLLLLGLSLSFVILHLTFLVRLYQYFLYVVIITDRKVHRIKRTLITLDQHQSVDLWVLQDIDKSQRGLFQNLLNFGTMTLNAQDTILRLHFTPEIAKRYEEIMFLRERARGQMPPVAKVTQRTYS